MWSHKSVTAHGNREICECSLPRKLLYRNWCIQEPQCLCSLALPPPHSMHYMSYIAAKVQPLYMTTIIVERQDHWWQTPYAEPACVRNSDVFSFKNFLLYGNWCIRISTKCLRSLSLSLPPIACATCPTYTAAELQPLYITTIIVVRQDHPWQTPYAEPACVRNSDVFSFESFLLYNNWCVQGHPQCLRSLFLFPPHSLHYTYYIHSCRSASTIHDHLLW